MLENHPSSYQGSDCKHTKITRHRWPAAAARWLEETEHKADHRKDLAKCRWLYTYLGGKHLDEIDRDLIDHVLEIKRNEASPSTANRYLAVIRTILNTARDDWEWIDKVPKFRQFKEPKKRIRWITQAEAERLLQELPPHLSAMAAFSLQTGLRQRNVSYLNWEQVSLERQTAWIHGDQSKNNRALAVPLNSKALDILLKQRGEHVDYVFTYQGKPVERTSTKAWYSALERTGIENFRWHDLRHT